MNSVKSINNKIPSALNLAMHTTMSVEPNEKPSKMSAILKSVSIQWSDEETIQRVREQIALLIRALDMLKEIANQKKVKPNEIGAAIEKINMRVKELSDWKGKKTGISRPLNANTLITKDPSGNAIAKSHSYDDRGKLNQALFDADIKSLESALKRLTP